MKSNNFLSNAMILTIGSVLAKIFSAIYRIGLTRILGGIGIGVYQLVFPVYSLCVVLASAGLPMAISKVIAKHKNNEKSVLKKCLLFTSLISLTLTFLLLIFSKGLASIQGNEDISICYILLAPTVIILSVSSVLRGYFQGKHNFTPSAMSNIVEQFIKLAVGLILSFALINVSLIASIIGAMVAIIASEIVSLVVLLLYFKKCKINSVGENVEMKELLKDVLPITITNIILPISTFIDSLLVVNLLAFNFSSKVSVFLYGLESGAVSSLASLPTIFSFAVASVVLPSVTGAKNSFNRNSKLSLAVKVILIICVPCVLSFMVIPDRLIDLLYGVRLNDLNMQGATIASRLLAISSFGVIFLAVNQIYSSCLQAINERMVTIRNLIIAIMAKLLIEIAFIPSAILNIYALAVSNTTCYLLVMALNHFEIRESFNLRLNYEFAGKLILCNLMMLLALLSVLAINKSAMNTVLGVVFAVVVYFASLYITNIFNRKDKAFLKYKI